MIRLIAVETEHNEERAKQFKSPNGAIPEDYVPRTRDWDKANTRLAQLLEDEELFENLARYYEKAHAIKAYAEWCHFNVDNAARVVEPHMRRLQELHALVKSRLQQLRKKAPRPSWSRRGFR